MILVDSSVWIEYFRGQESRVANRLDKLMAESFSEVATCAPILMELRMGHDDLARRRIEALLGNIQRVELEADTDFELAADIYRSVRTSGHTVRSSVDCLIAAIATRADALLVHADVDFDRIAAVVPGLRVESLR